MQSLSWTTEKLEDHSVTLVELTGEIDSSNGLDPFRTMLLEDKFEYVAILMSGVTYVNSSGCGGLIELNYVAESRGCHLFLVEPIDNVVKVLKEIGGGKLLHIVDSLQEVIQLTEAQSF